MICVVFSLLSKEIQIGNSLYINDVKKYEKNRKSPEEFKIILAFLKCYLMFKNYKTRFRMLLKVTWRIIMCCIFHDFQMFDVYNTHDENALVAVKWR